MKSCCKGCGGCLPVAMLMKLVEGVGAFQHAKADTSFGSLMSRGRSPNGDNNCRTRVRNQSLTQGLRQFPVPHLAEQL